MSVINEALRRAKKPKPAEIARLERRKEILRAISDLLYVLVMAWMVLKLLFHEIASL